MSDQSGTQSGYTPMPGEPARGSDTVGPAPSSVFNAVRLMFFNVAIGVLGVIVSFATKDSLRKEVLKQHHDYSAKKLDDVVNASIVAGLVIAIIFVVLYALLALQVGKGKNWARIVTWILAGLGVLGSLTSFAQPEPAVSRVVTLVGGVIDLAIIVLLAQRASNQYFRKTPP
jgi:magnesium-transporting ATPase (P-type)